MNSGCAIEHWELKRRAGSLVSMTGVLDWQAYASSLLQCSSALSVATST
jgi:hypothetical protein